MKEERSRGDKECSLLEWKSGGDRKWYLHVIEVVPWGSSDNYGSCANVNTFSDHAGWLHVGLPLQKYSIRWIGVHWCNNQGGWGGGGRHTPLILRLLYKPGDGAHSLDWADI